MPVPHPQVSTSQSWSPCHQSLLAGPHSPSHLVLWLIMPKDAQARVPSVWCPHPGSLGRTDPPAPAWERRGHQSAGVVSHRATARACKAAEGLPKCREQKSPLFPALGPASPTAHPKRPEKKDCEFFTLRSASASSAIASACFPEVSMTSRSCSAQARHSLATTHRPRTPRTQRRSARCVDVTQAATPREPCEPTSGLKLRRALLPARLLPLPHSAP